MLLSLLVRRPFSIAVPHLRDLKPLRDFHSDCSQDAPARNAVPHQHQGQPRALLPESRSLDLFHPSNLPLSHHSASRQRQIYRTHPTLTAEICHTSIPTFRLHDQSFPFALSVSLHDRKFPRPPHSSPYAFGDGLITGRWDGYIHRTIMMGRGDGHFFTPRPRQASLHRQCLLGRSRGAGGALRMI